MNKLSKKLAKTLARATAAGTSSSSNSRSRSRGSSTSLSRIHRFPGILFPDRLRTKGVINFNLETSFVSTATGSIVAIVSNPANGCINNMSGLSWLMSGAHTDGTSVAPYQTGCVIGVDIELYSKTVTPSTGGSGAQVCFFPLQQNQSSTSLVASNASEAFLASKVLTVPAVADTNSYSAPQLRKHYSLARLFGVPDELRSGNPTDYGFDYNSTLGNFVGVAFVLTTEDQGSDATLKIRTVVKMTFDFILSARNVLNIAGPSG